MLDLLLLFIIFIVMVWRTLINARDYYYIILNYNNDEDLTRLASDAFLFTLIVCSLSLYLFVNSFLSIVL